MVTPSPYPTVAQSWAAPTRFSSTLADRPKIALAHRQAPCLRQSNRPLLICNAAAGTDPFPTLEPG